MLLKMFLENVLYANEKECTEGNFFMLRSNGIEIKVGETRRHRLFSRCYWHARRLGSRASSLSRSSLEPGRIAIGIVERHHVADAVQAVAKDGLAATGDIGTTLSRSIVIKHTRNERKKCE